MKKVLIQIKNGKKKMDFSGFFGNACSEEELLIRTMSAKMGVDTDVINEKKEEKSAEIEREFIKGKD